MDYFWVSFRVGSSLGSSSPSTSPRVRPKFSVKNFLVWLSQFMTYPFLWTHALASFFLLIFLSAPKALSSGPSTVSPVAGSSLKIYTHFSPQSSFSTVCPERGMLPHPVEDRPLQSPSRAAAPFAPPGSSLLSFFPLGECRSRDWALFFFPLGCSRLS